MKKTNSSKRKNNKMSMIATRRKAGSDLATIFMRVTAVVLLAFITVVIAMPSNTFAYEKIDLNRETSLAVQFTGGLKLQGVEFRAYKIATVDENANFTFTEAILSYGVAVPSDQAGYRALAETLSEYVARDGINYVAKATTDAEGKASFGTMEMGLYLVTAERYTNHADGMTYIVSPSIVALPTSTNGTTWMYDVTVAPKYRSVPPVPKTEGEATDINVIKVWSGEANREKRPSYVYAELICDGVVIDTVTLNSGNNWRYTWKELDASKTYNVTEKEVPAGYTVTIVRDGNTFTMNNYSGDVPPPTPPGVPKLPQTGQLWWPVPILASVGIVLCIMGTLKKRAN